MMDKITANNFITDDKTDKVYMSSLIDKSTGDLDADVRSQLKTELDILLVRVNFYITQKMFGQETICPFNSQMMSILVMHTSRIICKIFQSV